MIDLHTDTIYALLEKGDGETLMKNSLSVDFERMDKAHVKAVCFALFTPPENRFGISRYEYFLKLHDRFEKEINSSGGKLRQAFHWEDILNGANAVLTVEDLGPLDGDNSKLEMLGKWGVKIASLIWNNENAYAYPNSSDSLTMSEGLKEKGSEAVEILSGMGITVDVSHLNDGGFYDIYRQKVRMCATHSNSRELMDHQRNITDDMAHKIADREGVIGVNVCPVFLSSYPEGTDFSKMHSRLDDIVSHIMHFYNVAGEDAIAFGSDLDGTLGILDIASPLDYEKLFDPLLKAGLSLRQLEKFRWLNALRMIQ